MFINDAAVKSQLLLDSNYISAREAVEASYVVPTPDCQVDFRNGISMLYGAGAVAFTGPAGSRGYIDKSGIAQTAAVNSPRLTAQGMLLNGATDVEVCTVPTANNIQGATSFTYCLHAAIPATSGQQLLQLPHASASSMLFISGANLMYRSVVAGVATDLTVMPAVSEGARYTVVSDAAANKTYVYVNGVLKLTVNSKQDVVSAGNTTLSTNSAAWASRYLQSFRTWLYALTPQQVSNL